MVSLLPRDDERRVARANVKRLREMPSAELAAAIMPVFGPGGPPVRKLWWGAQGIEVLQICDWLMRDYKRGHLQRAALAEHRYASPSLARRGWSDRKHPPMGAPRSTSRNVATDCAGSGSTLRRYGTEASRHLVKPNPCCTGPTPVGALFVSQPVQRWVEGASLTANSSEIAPTPPLPAPRPTPGYDPVGVETPRDAKSGVWE